MPDFRAFSALRYARDTDLSTVLSPPYDVLSAADVEQLYGRSRHNITHVDVPANQDYLAAASLMQTWIDTKVLVRDTEETLSIYRMEFCDAWGVKRQIVGVLGGLEVVDENPVGGATTVLGHERTTPKAKTDRLDLTRATATNLSPVWGLSLAKGLTDALQEPGAFVGEIEVDQAIHRVEMISDQARIDRIRTIMASDDVLISDGHHRYAVSRTYRDEVRASTGRNDTAAEQTLTFVSELIEDQLCIEAIHRVYSEVSPANLRAGLASCFDFSPIEQVSDELLAAMVEQGRLVLLWPDGSAQWLIPIDGAFDSIRSLDGLWLETALANTAINLAYQHGFTETLNMVTSGAVTAGVLIRPTSIAEIRRTARERLLMPPKSTFFTPKLLTGWVIRPTEPLPK